jgi:phage gp36-like protein
MAFLTTSEIYTHLYAEVSNEISRADATILQSAIDAAIEEARGYLTQYDTAATFALTGVDRNAVLVMRCKDIAVWHYIQLANPAVEMSLRLTRYEQAIKWLEHVQSGKTNPTLPAIAAATDGSRAETYLKYGSNHKRNNQF